MCFDKRDPAVGQSGGGYEGGRATLWNWFPAPFTDDVEERVTDAVRRLVGKVGLEAGD